MDIQKFPRWLILTPEFVAPTPAQDQDREVNRRMDPAPIVRRDNGCDQEGDQHQHWKHLQPEH